MSIPSNPWFGPDHKLRSAALSAIDGAPAVPDAPPLARRELAAFEARWVTNVAEAYRAVYRSPERSGPQVWAVRFSDAALATTRPPLMRGGSRDVAPVRVVRGATVIQVSGNEGSDYFKAVVAHVRSTSTGFGPPPTSNGGRIPPGGID